jgi:hypothetical protein
MKIGLGGIGIGSNVYGGSSNLLQKTEAFGDAYWNAVTDTTVTSNAIAAPNGTTTADLLTAGATLNDRHGVTITLSPAQSLTYSIHVLRGNADWFSLHCFGEGTERLRAWFDINTGVVGSVTATAPGSGVSSTMQGLGGGWFRCSVSGVLGGAGATVLFQNFCSASNGSLTKVSGATRYLWGAQAQVGNLGVYRPAA